MDWLNLLQDIFNVCIVPLLGVLTIYVVNYIKLKSEEIITKSENELVDKYTAMLAETISACVLATNQTYVDALKQKNAFDAEAQKQAFQMTFDAVSQILTEDAKVYLTEAFGDLNTYMTQQIEAAVKQSKMGAQCSHFFAFMKIFCYNNSISEVKI